MVLLQKGRIPIEEVIKQRNSDGRKKERFAELQNVTWHCRDLPKSLDEHLVLNRHDLGFSTCQLMTRTCIDLIISL